MYTEQLEAGAGRPVVVTGCDVDRQAFRRGAVGYAAGSFIAGSDSSDTRKAEAHGQLLSGAKEAASETSSA